MLKLKDIHKSYQQGSQEFPILKGIDLHVKEGDFLAIMGPSGSGKSTLMNIIGCLDKASSGTYHIEGTDVSELSDNQLSDLRNQKIGFVFQNFNLMPKLTACQNVELPLTYMKIPKKENFDQRIKEIFDNGNCLYSAKRNHNEFVTYFVYDKNFIKNLDEIEYDYTFDHIYVYPKLGIITLLPLLGDILTINKDKINIHLSEQIIHRNKYLFNDDRASFVWLRSNDTWFLESLVKTFGYVEDKALLDFVLKENYKDLAELEKILISRSCGGKNRLNIEVFAVVKGWKKKELSDFSFRIQELMYTLIKKEEQGKSEIDFPELTKILSETAYHMSKTDEDSYYNFFPILNLTEKYREEIEKKNFYNNPDLKRVWDETKTGGRWRPGMEE